MCIRGWLFLLPMLLLMAAPATAGNPAPIMEPDAVVAIDHADFVFANQTQIPSAGWQQHTLPMTDYFAAKTPATSQHKVLWVRFVIDRANFTPSPIALTTNYASERFILYLNGRPVHRNYSDPAAQNFASASPWFIPLAREQLQPGRNEIVLRLESDTYWSLGLGRTLIGSESAIRAIYDRDFRFQIQAPKIINGIIAVISIAAFLLWLARRKEQSFGWLALLGAVWFVRNIHYTMIKAPFGPYFSWEISSNAIFILTVVFYCFAVTFFDVAGRWRLIARIAMAGAFMIALRFGLLAFGQNDLIPNLLTIPMTAVLVYIFVAACQRAPTAENFSMLFAAVIAVSFSIHDFGVQAAVWQGAWVALQPYAGLFVFSSFAFALGRRTITALAIVENVNAALELRVADATDKLARSEVVRRELEVLNAVEKERERLMLEIHDGIGSNLITALAVAEKQQQSPETIKALKRSLTELRMAVDSLEPIEGEFPLLLASLRYRMEPDLAAAGISLDWQVEETPRIDWLDATSSLHLLRIMQEGISNSINHAAASRIIIKCHSATRSGKAGIAVLIADNGIGLPRLGETTEGGGKGLANMRARANSLNGEIACVGGQNGGTELSLWLPLVLGPQSASKDGAVNDLR